MLRRQLYFVLVVLFALAANALCQPAIVEFCYQGNGAPPGAHLGCPCANGVFPDGITACAFRDANHNGPDGSDSLIWCWVLSSDSADHFCSGELAGDSLMPWAYVMVGGTCCWHTRDFAVVPGTQQIQIGWYDWSCVDHTCSQVLAVPQRRSEQPLHSEIAEVYPNPFNPETRIQFTLSAPENMRLAVYNLAGQQVKTLAASYYEAGTHAVTWDGKNDAGVPVGTGLYLCRMTTTHAVSAQRLLLLK